MRFHVDKDIRFLAGKTMDAMDAREIDEMLWAYIHFEEEEI